MSKIINIKDTAKNSDEISVGEAATILGMNYGAAYNLIKYTNKITKFDYGKRNIRVSRASTLAYKEAHRIQGQY